MEFTPAERMELALCNGISVMPKLEKVKKFLKTFQMSEADKVFVLQHASEKNPIERAHAHAESFLNTHGGQQHATQTEIELISITGQKFKRNNTIIPLPFGLKQNRPVMRPACMLGTFLQVKNKKVLPQGNVKELQKAWRDSTVMVAGIKRLQDCGIEILMNDPAFKLKLEGGSSSMSSDDFILTIALVLLRCPIADYVALHQILVYEVFRFFQRRVTTKGVVEWRRYKIRHSSGERRPFIPDKALSTVEQMFPTLPDTLKLRLEEIRKECNVPKLYFLTGFIDASHTFQDCPGTLESAIKAFQLSGALRSGESVATSRLYDMLGFTGLCDDFGQKISLLLAMAMGVRQHFLLNKVPEHEIMIDVQLLTTGDAPLLASSLHARMPNVNWKLKIPRAGDWSKIHKDLYKFLVEYPRPGATLVKYSDNEFQTYPSLGDYREKSNQEVPRQGQSVETPQLYVMYIPIFGPYWWNTEEKSKAEALENSLRQSNSFIPVPVPPLPISVYSYGSSARFRGIVTNLPNFALVGADAKGLVTIDLKKFESEASWYKRVVASMGEKNSYWINPYPHYSPITNLVLSSRATVVYARTTPVGPEDTYAGDVVDINDDYQPSDDDEEGWEGVSAQSTGEDIDEEGDDGDEGDGSEGVDESGEETGVPAHILNAAEQQFAAKAAPVVLPPPVDSDMKEAAKRRKAMELERFRLEAEAAKLQSQDHVVHFVPAPSSGAGRSKAAKKKKPIARDSESDEESDEPDETQRPAKKSKKPHSGAVKVDLSAHDSQFDDFFRQ
jgi:hypothetical protein